MPLLPPKRSLLLDDIIQVSSIFSNLTMSFKPAGTKSCKDLVVLIPSNFTYMTWDKWYCSLPPQCFLSPYTDHALRRYDHPKMASGMHWPEDGLPLAVIYPTIFAISLIRPYRWIICAGLIGVNEWYTCHRACVALIGQLRRITGSCARQRICRV